MYKGTMYFVSCRQLEELGYNVPLHTKEGSYKAANEWWTKKLALLNSAPASDRLANSYTDEQLDELIQKGRAAEAMQQAKLAVKIMGKITDLPEENEIRERLVDTLCHSDPDNIYNLDAQLRDKPFQKKLTIVYQKERFLNVELARGKASSTYKGLAFMLGQACKCPAVRLEMAVSDITNSTITDLYVWLRGTSGFAERSQQRIFMHFKRFVKWLWSENLLELPRNLDNRQFSFDAQPAAIPTYPLEQVRQVIASLPDRLKLYALMGANMGMTAVDIGQLRRDEWQGRRIIRKRSKTRKQKSVPIVNYPLWEETRALLERFTGTHAELVLSTQTGKPLWSNEPGKHKINRISELWVDRSVPIPLKAFRSIGANLLSQHREYVAVKKVYLGHAPSEIADKHYANYGQELFDEAVLWLHDQIFHTSTN